MLEIIPLTAILYLAFKPKINVLAERIKSMKRLANPEVGKMLNITSVSDIYRVIKSIEYRPDIFDVTYPPELTLKRGYGDCEDFSVLTYSLLMYLNKNPGIAIAYNPDDPEAHAFTYFYCPECNEYYIFSNNEMFVASSVEEAANMLGFSRVIYENVEVTKHVHHKKTCCS